MAPKGSGTDNKGKTTKTKTTSTGTTLNGPKKLKTDAPLLNQPGDIDPHAFDVTADKVIADQVDLTDPNFNFDKVTSGKISAGQLTDRFMTAADYTLLDPADVQNEFGDITRSETQKNAAVSSKLALDSLDTELKGLLNYAPTAANLQRQETAKDNTFNSAERLKGVDAADPNIRVDLNTQRDRFRAEAEGRLPDSIMDRQLELGIQSSAADQAAVGGFGAGSSAAAKAGSLMSAQERFAISQAGDQALSGNIAQRTSTLVAPTEYSNAGSQINVMPSQSAGAIANQIAAGMDAGNITAKDALQSKVQQEQFKSGLEQDTNKTNLTVQSDRDLNQAKLNLDAATTNEANSIQAQTVNASNNIQTQTVAKQLQSSERTFNAELKTNTAVANADRVFNANNANAGRALEVATSNRAVKLQVDQANKTMVFQDQQRQKSEKFTAGQNAAARAAAGAASAGSASDNAAAIAAAQSEADKDRAFQLQQQQMALDIYKQNRSDAQGSQDWASAGTLITKGPDIIKGGSSLINTITGWFGGGDYGTGGFEGDIGGYMTGG